MGDKERMSRDGFDAEWDEDLDVEIVDLESFDDTEDDVPTPLRKTHIPSWSVKPVLRWQRSFSRKRWRTISVVFSLFLVCLVLLLNLHITTTLLTNARNAIASRILKQTPQLTEKLPTPLTLTPTLDISLATTGYTCVTSEAWSHDSSQIALLGYSSGCEYDTENAIGLATIHDAYNGSRLVRLEPDTPIKQAFYAQFPAIHDSVILYYQTITWSPDKQHLALLFNLHTRSQVGGAAFSGVLIFDANKQTSRVFLQQQDTTSFYQTSSSAYLEWDTKSGQTIATPFVENIDPFVYSSNIPVAQAYTWDNDGTLMPHFQNTTRTTKVGNPNGDTSFTIWQPGNVELIKQDETGGITFSPGVFVWSVLFTTWSPDGRYLINGAYLAARVDLPGHPIPDKKTLTAFHMENLPVLPLRDAALLSALRALVSSENASAFLHMNVGWSPNGQLMLMTTYEQSRKTLYSSKRGYTVARLQAPKINSFDVQSTHLGYYAYSSASWSPDGTRIFAQDPGTNAVVVWNVPPGLQ
jgi:hypothetical protein